MQQLKTALPMRTQNARSWPNVLMYGVSSQAGRGTEPNIFDPYALTYDAWLTCIYLLALPCTM